MNRPFSFGTVGPALEDDHGRRSWDELDDDVRRLVTLLRSAGVEEGETVGLLMANRLEFFEAVLACLAAGAWCTPINWHLTTDEVHYVLSDCGATVVLCDEAGAERVGSRPGVRRVRLDDGSRLLASYAPSEIDSNARAGKIMYYTSGTTGRPKGVRPTGDRTLSDELSLYQGAARTSGVDADGPHLVTGPLYHGAPLVSALMALTVGAPVLVMDQWDAEGFLRTVHERRVRDTHLVPIMFVRLLRLPQDVRARYDLSSLRTVHHGAAPVPISVKAEMIEWFGPVLREYWASTEGGLYTEVDSPEWLKHPGTVGRAVEGYEIYAGDEHGSPLPPGTEGILYLRAIGDTDGFAYHGDAEKTAATFRGPRTFTVGDMGRVDEEGYVYLTDRTAEVVISGGVNIYPAEIEQCLLEHHAVLDAGVYSVPDEEWGEAVHAAVVATGEVEAGAALASALRAYLSERVAGYKIPRTISFVDELPRSDAGKLYRRRLRDLHPASP